MKRLFCTVFIAGSVLLTGGAIADDIKPGQRMIYDDRAPKEPSELDKPIYNKPVVVPKQTREEPVEGNDTEVPENTPAPAADTAQDPDGTVSDADDNESPPVYVTPQDEGEEDSDVLGLEDRSPQEQKRLRKMTDDFMEDMPHKDVDLERLQDLSPEEQTRMLKELKEYTGTHSKEIQEELAE